MQLSAGACNSFCIGSDSHISRWYWVVCCWTWPCPASAIGQEAGRRGSNFIRIISTTACRHSTTESQTVCTMASYLIIWSPVVSVLINRGAQFLARLSHKKIIEYLFGTNKDFKLRWNLVRFLLSLRRASCLNNKTNIRQTEGHPRSKIGTWKKYLTSLQWYKAMRGQARYHCVS
jgi:hypothetical protein